MPRHNNRDRRATPVPRSIGAHRVEPGPAGYEIDHHVRTISASAAVKNYLCPGCNQSIVVGVAHVVAWPVTDRDGEDRRHWHTGCWRGRATRTGYR
ncbi:ATP/GTP-binding protein [Williamsia sp. CHRR-6]|uniref:ATP/GTP-binding protein n=1 Tax=Williamsia sp. CHRR-6 TaxID=2835871 RepID=UPI001BDB1FBE|nr:ATP/GTP-binding protein [Williamsia sp. CHRR-6]MBT0568232.1 ATP/GTP-binding protein [Williamsia sp. CHRR-6]